MFEFYAKQKRAAFKQAARCSS